jgi:hypothetical protein
MIVCWWVTLNSFKAHFIVDHNENEPGKQSGLFHFYRIDTPELHLYLKEKTD